MTTTDVTLEQLVTAIECFNLMHANKKSNGTFSANVHDILAGGALFAKFDTQWEMVKQGPMKGCRSHSIRNGASESPTF